MNRALIERTIAAMTKGHMDGDHSQYFSALEELRQELENKSKPYAWRNPMNGAVIDDRKKHQPGIGNGYPNFSEPLYSDGSESASREAA